MKKYKSSHTYVAGGTQRAKGCKSVRKAISVCCLLALSVPGAIHAQQQTDTLTTDLPKSALDYMLQRPRVSKQYENKHLGDHLFTDLGLRVNAVNLIDMKPGAQAQWAVGDFITPEHGVRLGVGAGIFRTKSRDVKMGELSLDYLMNITALANRNYEQAHRFEVLGVAGIDAVYARYQGESKKALGAHIGLRGQYAFSPYTYIYIEPQVGVLHNNATFSNNWRCVTPVASVSAGLGYRLLSPAERAHAYGAMHTPRYEHFTDGMFVGVAGGASMLVNAHPSTWKNQMGGRASVSVGKWFDAYNAVRLTLPATVLKQPQGSKVKAVGVALDYMANLHNVFGGVDLTRRWWVNGVAGLSVNGSSSNNQRNVTWGVGAGLQGNVHLGGGVNFVLEPRVDVYDTDYAMGMSTSGRFDVVPSMLLGFVYTHNPLSDSKMHKNDTDPFVTNYWHDHTFIEMAAGANINITTSNLRRPFRSLRPQGYLGLGKWFAPLHGARLWIQADNTRCDASQTMNRIDVGADYLFNFTNAFRGYQEDRLFEVTGGLGMNLSAREGKKNLFFGLDASLRGTWHVSPFCALYVEPKLQGYGKNYLPTSISTTKIDLVASGMAGVQFDLRAYGVNRVLAADVSENDEAKKRGFISVAGGAVGSLRGVRNKETYNGLGRISYTLPVSALAAYRMNIQGRLGKYKGEKYADAMVGADFISDLTAHAYGYDADRVLSVSALGGLNLGADYNKGRSYFTSDIHVGGILAARVAQDMHVFVEPQLGYHMSRRFKEDRLSRLQPLVFLGVDYSLGRNTGAVLVEAPQKRRYVTVNMGSGINSMNLSAQKGAYRFTFNASMGYGQWLTGLHGFEVDLANMMVNRTRDSRYNVTALRANYMMNLRTAVTGESTDDKLFQLTGLVGASLNINSGKDNRKTQVAPGFGAALQAGWRISPSFELYLQPEADFYSQKIIAGGTSHPLDGQLTLSAGTKFSF